VTRMCELDRWVLPDLLDRGVVWIQRRVDNVHIVPVFGKSALRR